MKKNLPTDEQIKKLYDAVKNKTKKKAIRLELDCDKTPELFNSKIGGVPYWDPDMTYPETDNGEKLIMLAQLNMSELPENDVFPKEGMLQFFILNDDDYGMSYDEPEHDGYKVVFHKKINTEITEKDIESLEIPTTLSLEEDDDNLFPVMGEFAVNFKNEYVFMNDCDCNFRSVLYDTAEELGIELDEDTESYDLLDEEEFDKMIDSTSGHWLLGYPFFTQYDPRNYEMTGKYNTMLFQLDSETGKDGKEILWGDSGVGAFFINEKNLKELNFDDVLYNWDCY